MTKTPSISLINNEESCRCLIRIINKFKTISCIEVTDWLLQTILLYIQTIEKSIVVDEVSELFSNLVTPYNILIQSLLYDFFIDQKSEKLNIEIQNYKERPSDSLQKCQWIENRNLNNKERILTFIQSLDRIMQEIEYPKEVSVKVNSI